MSRKVFLSFLGTGNYKKCKYSSEEKGESKVVEFVQEAILDLYCNDFEPADIAYFFLTKEAETKHWENLKESLGERPFQIKPVKDISEGNTEKEIWKIFELVYSILKKEDKVILDVTHGFRSLPMLGIVLLNYAKSLKNIEVSHILYGAFEGIGIPAYQIENEIPDPEKRTAPLFDLTAFSAIQSWTYGAESFIRTGNSKLITELSKENIKPILIESKGNDETANNIRSLMDSLNKIETAINTNRGQVINQGGWVKRAKDSLRELQTEHQVFAPIKPILKKIENKLNHFEEKPHWEAAVEWCIKHGLVQQGITQLQEGIISYVLLLVELDDSSLKAREIVAQALHIFSQRISEEDWRSPAAENKEIVKKILSHNFIIDHNDNYQRLSEYRNDINHGGYKEKALRNGEKFTSKLSEIFAEFNRIKSI